MKLNNLGANQTEIEMDGKTVLFSYKTPVAAWIGNGTEFGYFRTNKKWSVTTSRHINKWLGDIRATEKEQEFFDNLVK